MYNPNEHTKTENHNEILKLFVQEMVKKNTYNSFPFPYAKQMTLEKNNVLIIKGYGMWLRMSFGSVLKVDYRLGLSEFGMENHLWDWSYDGETDWKEYTQAMKSNLKELMKMREHLVIAAGGGLRDVSLQMSKDIG